MSLKAKQFIIFILGLGFLASLIFVQWAEVVRREQESGVRPAHILVPKQSKKCVECHQDQTPGIVSHWVGSTHARKGVACLDCHKANKKDADAYDHYGAMIATIVTPRDCGVCHPTEAKEFEHSHHAKAGNILASLDNFLAETVEGARVPFNPHGPTPGRLTVTKVNGMASVNSGCRQCHGSKVALIGTDGSKITVDDLKPDENGIPTVTEAVEKIKRDENGRPTLDAGSWPNTGIGRLNLDGSLGSCSACHSRHDFSPRRGRQPENCGKCHLGPDHPQKEIYEESKHGVAYRDMKDKMNLDGETWVLGQDYSQAPTCATCHMSGHSHNNGKITHDVGRRISWTNRPPISIVMDTDKDGNVIKETDPDVRRRMIADSWKDKRVRMTNVCLHCHTKNYVNAFYSQYDDFVINYNEKFARPGKQIMGLLKSQKLLSPKPFDEEIEWTWFYLWHHEGRRARHGASMMAPDYAHWHGMYEVAERFYQQLIPQALELAEQAERAGNREGAEAVRGKIDGILARPEHQWFLEQRRKLDAAPATPAAAAEAKPAEPQGTGEQPAKTAAPASGQAGEGEQRGAEAGADGGQQAEPPAEGAGQGNEGGDS